MRNFGKIQYSGWGEIPKAGAIPTATELRNWAISTSNSERASAGLPPLGEATVAGADVWVDNVNRGQITVLMMAENFVKGLNDSSSPNTAVQLQQMIQSGVFSAAQNNASNSSNGGGNSNEGSGFLPDIFPSNDSNGSSIIQGVPNWATYTGAGVLVLASSFFIIKSIRG
jgi:hypothetical protein